MKKFLFTVMAIAIVSTTFAQGKIGIHAGANISDVSMKEGIIETSFDPKVGFHAGVSYELPFSSTIPLFFETGLYAFMKSVNMTEEREKATMNLFYLQLPALLGYNFEITDEVALKPFAGLFVGYGISGKAKYGDLSADVFKKDEDGYQTLKRGDMGLRLGAGVEFNQHYYVGFGYEMGLMNMAKEYDNYDSVTAKSSNFTITVGYNF
jgi:hypothetical protein